MKYKEVLHKMAEVPTEFRNAKEIKLAPPKYPIIKRPTTALIPKGQDILPGPFKKDRPMPIMPRLPGSVIKSIGGGGGLDLFRHVPASMLPAEGAGVSAAGLGGAVLPGLGIDIAAAYGLNKAMLHRNKKNKEIARLRLEAAKLQKAGAQTAKALATAADYTLTPFIWVGSQVRNAPHNIAALGKNLWRASLSTVKNFDRGMSGLGGLDVPKYLEYKYNW